MEACDRMQLAKKLGRLLGVFINKIFSVHSVSSTC